MRASLHIRVQDLGTFGQRDGGEIAPAGDRGRRRAQRMGAILFEVAGAASGERRLRQLALDTGLTEEFKWRQPCYAFDGTKLSSSVASERAGLKVKFKEISEHKRPDELEAKFKESPKLKKAFEALTPGRQRAYLPHFSQPKQSKTRVSRIEKCEQQILNGKGMRD